MATIEVILRDDEGNVLGPCAESRYLLELGEYTLDEIEGEVERFKQQALPEIEQALLRHGQTVFTQEKKNDIGCL